MNWLRLAIANLRASPLTTLVNVVLLGLGTASIVLLLLISHQLANTLSRDARGIDLVLGAKGSPIQLVLSSVYHADVPTGNILRSRADQWASDPRVAQAIPLSLGDSYRGFRIVGTTPSYVELYRGQIETGGFWTAPMQAVAGSAAARESRLAPGSRFAGNHGLVDGGHAHEAQLYEIVGVLAPTGTVLDRLILTSLESVWDLHAAGGHTEHPEEHAQQEDKDRGHDEKHDHHREHDAQQEHHHHGDEPESAHGQEAAQPDDREITAMLLQYDSPLAATSLPRQINAESNLLAAAPAFEVTRLLNLVGLGLDGLHAFAVVLILTAAFSVFAALYGALKARRHDLAMLRCLGATRGEVLLSLLIEGLLLAAAGALLGFALGHGTMELLGRWLEASRGVSATGAVWLASETALLAGLLLVGLLSAALPAWQAYRTDVARTLAS